MGVALITGASAGIGAELAKLFAKDGHSVCMVARRQERLEELAIELIKINSNIKTWVYALDMAAQDSPHKLKEFTDRENIPVDFLVNNAGFGSAGAFSKLELAKELEMIDLNVRALVSLTHLMLPPMLERRTGRILNVGSTAGFQPGPFMTTYYATKAFVNSFSEGLHHELKDTGVTCTVLAPGPTTTEFMVVAKLEKNKLFNYVQPATALAVAESGYKAMMRGEAVCVQGFRNNLLVQTLRITPRNIVRKITATLNQF